MKSRIIQLCILAWSVFLISCSENDEPFIPEEKPLLEITLNKSEMTMGVSDIDTLSVITDIGVLNPEFESSNTAIITVDDQGIIEALSPGSAEITVTVDDLVAKCQVVVKLKMLELNHSDITLKVTDRDTLLVTSELFDETVVWESSDPSVVSVDENGRLVALTSGSSEITATVDDLSTTCMVNVDVTIFLGGYYNEYDAAYWKNGVIHPLTTDGSDEGYNSYVNSIKVVNGNIYSGGQKYESYNTVWKNNEETILELAGWSNELMELAVWKDEVIAVGGRYRAYLWSETDGVTYWSGEGVETSGSSVFVSNSDIYMGGTQNIGNINRASIWKNQQAFTLDYTIYHIVRDIFVDQEDFYTCATEYISSGQVKSKYWKNETLIELTDGTYSSGAYSIAVLNGDVYVGGHKKGKPVIWKNGEEIFYEASDVQGTIKELTIHGDDLYAVGNVKTGSTYAYVGVVWKNGEEIFRTELFDNAYLNCIDVK